jgi:murein DD-endopeptidase MepM/ murein hydrolase activator NlpD
LLVKEGQIVRKGDVIARVGTGDGEDGSRLHFEMRKARVPVDPVKQLGK